ncbi:hypothetical protein D3C76_1438980 [compost metagenome]
MNFTEAVPAIHNSLLQLVLNFPDLPVHAVKKFIFLAKLFNFDILGGNLTVFAFNRITDHKADA